MHIFVVPYVLLICANVIVHTTLIVLWCLVGYSEPLPVMVKEVTLRARDCSADPIDFTQTWVDEAPKRGRLMLGGHPEMDESHYVCGPTAPSMFIDMISKALFMSSYYALDKNGMHATSKMTYKLVFIIRFTCYTLKCFVCHYYAPKHSYTLGYAPKYFMCHLIHA